MREGVCALYDTNWKICPGCGHRACHWIGGGPKDVECINEHCEFYKEKLGEGKKRYQFSSDKPYEETEKDKKEDTKKEDHIDFSDWDFSGL